MDKILNFQNFIVKSLTDFCEKGPKNKSYKYQTIFDKENHHYLVQSIGWKNDIRVYKILIHFDIIDNKIWVQENRTEADFQDELQEFKISKEDIVIGYLEPIHR
jgi:hypothetical protein